MNLSSIGNIVQAEKYPDIDALHGNALHWYTVVLPDTNDSANVATPLFTQKLFRKSKPLCQIFGNMSHVPSEHLTGRQTSGYCSAFRRSALCL